MKRGFTLVELLVCIALLAVLAVVAIPVVSSVNGKAGDTADAVTAQSVETAIDAWMQTKYEADSFYRTNLYNSASTGEAATARINGLTEQLYSYYFAGTGQLPGTELTDEAEIRHSVISAVKATSGIPVLVRDGQQFLQSPQTGAQYGFKYYYKLGRVSVEDTEASGSVFGNDEVYRYYVWLDRPGGNTDSTVIPKTYRGSEYLFVATEELCSIAFDYGVYHMADVRIAIVQDGIMTYTFDALTETPRMFKPGWYTVLFYLKGDLVCHVPNMELTASGQVVSMN